VTLSAAIQRMPAEVHSCLGKFCITSTSFRPSPE